MPGFEERLDPGLRGPLRAFLDALPEGYGRLDHRERRAIGDRAGAAARRAAPAGDWEERLVDDGAGARPVRVRLYRPAAQEPARAAGAVLLIHGGGMWAGGLDAEHANALDLAERLRAVVVSVEYRLAPEHPYPAGLDDCATAYAWLRGACEELGVDPARICIAGGSAGGGLAIALALRCRDAGLPAAAFVAASYPMLDDRNDTASAHEFTVLPEGLYDARANAESWGWYLGGRPADGFAAPARATDLRGLPPMFVDVGDLDVFRDEDLAFATRLAAAGVPVELHLYPGAFHASELLAPDAALSLRMVATRHDALRRALLRSG